ncbi:MAG TPA: tetratricopeptide repeat protein [Thermodesulfovibrionales bacterium]|nr:tetratricopeptide repeat protein [Thermodesulfovibrionales bacterium]
MKTTLDELYHMGKELFQAGKYSEAEPVLKDVVRMNERYADVWNMLGIVAHLDGRIREACESFERALHLNPLYTEVSLNLAIAYNDLGEFKKAQDVFSMAAQIARPTPTSLDPFAAGKLANEHFKLGNMYLELNLHDDAVDEYAKALRLHPDAADIRTKLGIALRSKGDHEEAVVQFTKAKEINPSYGQAWVQLGLTYYMKGMIGLALQEWERALACNPNLKEAETYLKLFRKEEK